MGYPIQLTLMRQLAGYLSVPVFLVDPWRKPAFLQWTCRDHTRSAVRWNRQNVGGRMVCGLHATRWCKSAYKAL